MSSAAEAEAGALFLNAKGGMVLHTTLTKMGHPQPPTPLQSNNSTAEGIIDGTVKQKWYKAMYAVLLGQGPQPIGALPSLLGPET
jgi:hypothetical protein